MHSYFFKLEKKKPTKKTKMECFPSPFPLEK